MNLIQAIAIWLGADRLIIEYLQIIGTNPERTTTLVIEKFT
ncbi:hypothetical protein [Pleurocapsa sp. PCC 7319]|nr:hypothetical protein [Pleurocapsa sp. PCC 7319]